MEITPMVSMAAESTDTERAQTSASQLVHCAQHTSAVEWICAGSSECARSNSTHTSKLLLRSRFYCILCSKFRQTPRWPVRVSSERSSPTSFPSSTWTS